MQLHVDLIIHSAEVYWIWITKGKGYFTDSRVGVCRKISLYLDRFNEINWAFYFLPSSVPATSHRVVCRANQILPL